MKNLLLVLILILITTSSPLSAQLTVPYKASKGEGIARDSAKNHMPNPELYLIATQTGKINSAAPNISFNIPAAISAPSIAWSVFPDLSSSSLTLAMSCSNTAVFKTSRSTSFSSDAICIAVCQYFASAGLRALTNQSALTNRGMCQSCNSRRPFH